jgi:quinol monooxygenase YgiN
MSDKGPVTVVITCNIQKGKVDLAKRELQSVIKKVILNEKACRDICVYEDPDNNQKLLIIEHWDNKEIFLGPHMQTPHMKEFFTISESFLNGKTEFTFWNEIRMNN